MGNANSGEEQDSNNPRQHHKKRQLRAKSFYKREQARESAIVDDGDQEVLIEKLENNIRRLSEKCAALEAQNILVSVQQLDILARFLSCVLSLLVLYLYWKLVVWMTNNLSLFGMLTEDYQNLLSDFLQRSDGNPLLNAFMMVYQHPWAPIIAKAVLLLLPYVYNRFTHGSTNRRFQVFVIAFFVVGRVRLCRWRERMFLQDDPKANNQVTRFGESCTNDGIWEANYEISARFLYLSILRLRGLWTKTAQYLSSRADFMPVGYIRELSKLQDQAPATPWEEVEKLLPKKLKEELTDIDQTPIASASIGQVHAARVKSTNQKVVIKVQHPHARTLMTDDFWSLKVITKILAWLEPDYAFMEILMREWAQEARKELDFRNEVKHLKEAIHALKAMFPSEDSFVYTNGEKRIPFQVEIPEPLEEFSNRDVLVMSFCEGCRVDDFAQIDNWELGRDAIMDGIAQTYAHYMYCSTIFNGDPHPGNMLVRPGIHGDSGNGFTLVLLDWGLAKVLPEDKRLAFCQMVYAAATFDYGLLLDSYKNVGLKMKREDAGQSLEDMRFFLRDMAPRDRARKRIKSKMRASEEKRKKTKEKVPMESKAYPGEFFFFIRVNELLHGLGSRFDVNLGYLDALKPYAERGLRQSNMFDLQVAPVDPAEVEDATLQKKLEDVLNELKDEKELVGGQVCILDKHGNSQADIATGSLGGLRSHIPMQRDALILGYSTTKAVTATLAHIMVEEGYLTYDEPVCERVWPSFCPTKHPPRTLSNALDLPFQEVVSRWTWKSQITLRHILNHSAGLWSTLPTKLTIKKMASCEECFAAYEYNPEAPEDTLLPTSKPGEKSEYHFMSFGWLVAGTLCGAFALKRGKNKVSFQEVYEDLLEPKLSEETKKSGFRPLGGSGPFVLAQTVTADIRASKIMQRKREIDTFGESDAEIPSSASEVLKTFRGKEFLLDPRIWNSQDALKANVPAAGGRFSAAALAHFYHDLFGGKLLNAHTLNDLSCVNSMETAVTGLQGVTRIANDSENNHTKLSFGFQLIRTERDKDDVYSGVGHAGVGGSIGFYHRPTGLCIGVMLNKADGGQNVTVRILRAIGDHFGI